jgi:RNA polymerase sigma-70 factor (ECF subfamily)
VDVVRDDQLRLIFTCAHPALPRASQVALTLKVVVGLTTEEIARAFVSEEPAIAQRIVRAKRTIEDQKLPYEIPDRSELPERVGAVLAVVYALFNEGHTSSQGPALMRIDLQAEAIRLARLLADLLPGDAEIFGLLALMTFSAARAATRVDDEGLPRELAAQDRSRWDRALVEEGLMALARARRLGPPGSYVLQAEIAALHVTAPSFERTDFRAILAVYDALLVLTGSPVVALNRAVALAMAEGPEAGLRALAPLEPDLARQHLFYATRAELTRRAGRDGKADDERALALATNDAERRLLERRLARASS